MRSPVRAMLLLASLGGALPAQPEAPRVRLTEELRLDANTEDFPRVGVVAVSPRREIVVAISTDQQLRVYDPSGKRIAVLGRKGSGPGEFAFIAGIGWHHDSMFVFDYDQNRTSFYSPGYTLARTSTWPIDGRLDRQVIRRFDAMGVVDGDIIGVAEASEAGGSASDSRTVLVRRTANDGIRLVLDLRPTAEEPWMMRVGIYGRTIPFAVRPLLAMSPYGASFAELTAPLPEKADGAFRLRVFDLNGTPQIDRTYPYRGVPIPARSADSAIRAINPTGRRPAEGPADMYEQFEAMARDRMPRWFIPVESLTLGLDRTIWIGLRPTSEGRGYLVLNSRGDPVGSVMVPVTTRVRQATATHIWVTETDDDGLSSVVRYRLTGLTCTPATC